MARTKAHKVFVCQECGYESARWAGRCPECSTWHSLLEVERDNNRRITEVAVTAPVEMATLPVEAHPRQPVALPEMDRVLGGGLVPGSLVLIGGDPGIGKSTLLLQAASLVAGSGRRVLYMSGEESAHQIRLRAQRLGIAGSGLFLLAETNLEAALAAAQEMSPGLFVVDSIQTVYWPQANSAPGSVVQLRECAMRLMRFAKTSGIPTCLVGHVTKEGDIAGPRLVEHIVDVVLYLEGERFSSYRLLRGVKNRFGSVNEVGVFEMTGDGMVGVESPSELFLAERAEGAVGSAIVPVLEGSRPLLVEVQALTSPSILAMPRRTANGVDIGRLHLIAAVLSRRLGLALGNQDIIVSVAGGLRVQEPAVDLAVALAMASSFRDVPLPRDLVTIGEVGLSGELRSVPQLERRLAEANRMGFRRCLLPRRASRRGKLETSMQLLPADTLREALRLALA